MSVVEDCDDGSETGFFSLDIVCDSSPRMELVVDEDVMLVKALLTAREDPLVTDLAGSGL